MNNIYLYVRKKFQGSKRGLVLAMIIMVCLQLFALSSEAQGHTYRGGDGSISNPYEIWTEADLDNVRKGLYSSYILMCDLDLSGVANWVPIGGFSEFGGTFDGQNFIISNMTIQRELLPNTGLFSKSTGTIKNLGLENVDITSVDHVTAITGALVGCNEGVVDRCYSTGVVKGTGILGGLLGMNYSSAHVSNSYSHADVIDKRNFDEFVMRAGGFVGRNYQDAIISNCYATGDVIGMRNVGGFVGESYMNAMIENCYATGDVKGYNDVGGFAGSVDGHSRIDKVYSTGLVQAMISRGGLVGRGSNYIHNGYFDIEKARTSYGGIHKTSAEMMQQATFVGFDFTNVWSIDENRSTPYLKTNIPSLLPNLINSAPSTDTLINAVEDTVKTGTLTAYDSDGDPVKFTVLQTTKQGVLTVSASGHYTYIPNENFNGTDGFIVSLSDPYTTTQVAVTVIVYRAPIALGETVVIDEDTIATGTVPIIDVDDVAIGYGIVSHPTNGQLTFNNQTGAFSYEPNLNFNGTDEFVFSVSSTLTTTQAAVTIVVLPVDEEPIALGKTVVIDEDTIATGTVPIINVDEVAIGYGIVSHPTNGQLTFNNQTGAFLYKPNLNFNGGDEFVFSVSSTHTTTQAVVTLQINPVNDAPIATAESFETIRNQSVTRTLKVSDVDSSSFTFSIISGPTSGSVVINSVTGEFTYSSPVVGMDQFTYRVSDGQATDTSVISIQVHEIVYPSTNVNQVSDGGGTAVGGVSTVGGSHSSLAGVKADGQGSIGFSIVPQVNGSTQVELTLISQDLGKVLKGILEKQATEDNQVDDDQLDNGQPSRGQGIATPQPRIEVKVNSQDNNVQINMSVQDIQNMQEAYVIFDVKTDLANYSLSTDAIDLEEILKAFGEGVDPKDIQVSIKIKQPDDQIIAILQGSATEQGLRLVVPPVEFEIEYTYKGQTVIGSSFKRYVERQIPIPAGVDPSTITTAVVLEEDGTLRPVPTKVEEIDGVFYAVINSLTNSVYALIHNEAHFADVTNHWAQAEIQDMSARLIIQGIDGVNYAPNGAITRAEFATIIVKALGLTVTPSDQIFADIRVEDWYYENIHTAVSYELVKGSVGSFRPKDFISRQEACTIISRALQVMGAKEVQDSDVLEGYVDTKEIATWALESIELCMKEEILQGKSEGYIKPKDLLTRAEAAVMVYRMLVKKGLI